MFCNNTISLSSSHYVSERVIYVQSNFNSSWDVFHFTLSDKQNILTGQHINITVQARISQHTPAVLTGQQLVLSNDFLDASELAQLTSSDPVFTVIRLPRYGDLVRLTSPQRKIPGHVLSR